jgi:hypothetical protein
VSDSQYNPLDKLNLGKSVAEALLDKPLQGLGELEPFEGAGIYAIYYEGKFSAYSSLAERNKKSADWPLYVGKAIPSGGRRGVALFSASAGRVLWNRLKDHADSIRAAKNLRIEDFSCRYLAVDDIWIPLGETLLIAKFRPAWNQILDGFGNHDPGAGRYQGMRPLWDVLHPGRGWALKCKPRSESAEDLAKRIRSFLKDNSPPADVHMKFFSSEK